MKPSYNLVIVDDHPMVIEGLNTMLSKIEYINVKANFNNAASFFEFRDLTKIDIVLLDVFLPDSNGIDLCLKIKKLYPKIIILVISSQAERSIVMQMIKNGANGYLLKSTTNKEFANCIQSAINGELVFSNEVRDIVNKTSVYDLKSIPRLTKREKEILILLKQGKSTQDISNALFLSFLTVQTHRRNLLSKFQVKNVIELVNFVHDNGLL